MCVLGKVHFFTRNDYAFLTSPQSLWGLHAAAAAAKSHWLRPTLCDPIDGSQPGSPIPGILQARTLEWVAISFSNAWKWKVGCHFLLQCMKVKSLSRVQLLAIPWTAAHQAPHSVGFSRQEYWNGVPLPSLRITWDYVYKPLPTPPTMKTQSFYVTFNFP